MLLRVGLVGGIVMPELIMSIDWPEKARVMSEQESFETFEPVRVEAEEFSRLIKADLPVPVSESLSVVPSRVLKQSKELARQYAKEIEYGTVRLNSEERRNRTAHGVGLGVDGNDVLYENEFRARLETFTGLPFNLVRSWL
jgi:hypothetical protein